MIPLVEFFRGAALLTNGASVEQEENREQAIRSLMSKKDDPWSSHSVHR